LADEFPAKQISIWVKSHRETRFGIGRESEVTLAMGIARWGVVVAKNDVRLVSAMPVTSADPAAILSSGMLWSSRSTAYTLTEERPFSGQRSEIPSIASVLGLDNPQAMVRYVLHSVCIVFRVGRPIATFPFEFKDNRGRAGDALGDVLPVTCV